jgi:hypothetical protein
VQWEKELHQWANAKAKQFTLNVGVAEDEHTTYAISIAEHAVLANKELCVITRGCVKLFNVLESFNPQLSLNFN